MHQYLDLCRYVLKNGTEKPDLVTFRAGRKPWLVVMTSDVFLKLIGRGLG